MAPQCRWKAQLLGSRTQGCFAWRTATVAIILCHAAIAARADFEQLSRRADDGTTYQVLQFAKDPNYNDADKFRVTTVAASVSGVAGCVSGGGASGATISAAVGVLVPLQVLHPFALVARTAIVAPNDPNIVTFDSRGAGKLSLGSGAAAITICRVLANCGGAGVPLVNLSTADSVGPACLASFSARCNESSLDLEAYAFGANDNGSPPNCSFTPTVDATICAPQPADDFDLHDGQAVVFVYDGELCVEPFATAAGGYGIDTDGTNPAGCGPGQVVTAQAWVPVLDPPPQQSPAACVPTATPTPTTIIVDHPTPTVTVTTAGTPTATPTATSTATVTESPTSTATPTGTPTATPTSTPTATATSCVSDPPLVYPVTSPTNQLTEVLSGYSPGLFCFRGGFIEISGVEVISQTQNCQQGTFTATIQLQPNQTNHVVVCLHPGLCGSGGCVPLDIEQISQTPTPTVTPTDTPTPCTRLPSPSLNFSLSVEPLRPMVGDPVLLSFTVSGNGGLPQYTLSGADPILQGDTSPVRTNQLGTVTYHLVAARAGTATLVLGVNYEAAFGCAERPIFQFVNATSPPFGVTVVCPGDCNGDGAVTINELITMVDVALASADVSSCLAGDANNDGTITISEIITAVNKTLNGC